MEKYENEVDLIEYLNVLWKRRGLIIVPTILLALVAGVVSFLIPPVWEVDVLLQPGKFFVQTESGEFKEVFVTDPKQLASEINQGSRNRLISAEFNLDPRKVPKLKAENLRDTKLVRVSLRTGETEKGQAILDLLFQHLKSELDRKIDVEINNLNTQVEQTKNKILDLENEIKTRENAILTTQNEIKIRQNGIKLKELDIESRKIDKEKLTKEIESDKSRLKITEDRIVSIYEELKSVKERIKELEEQQRKALAEPKEGTAAVALLLYSTEVQRNFQYSNSLDEKASAERLNRERVAQDIQSKTDVLRQIDNQIDQVRTGMDSNRTEIETMKTGIENIKNDILKVRNNINNANNEIKLIEDKKNRIDYTQLVKEPTASFSPVSPRKKVNVAIAGFLGFFCFSILALFLDYVKKGNIRLKTGS
jgi:capsular polysaccharide biosynthesis protein